MPTLRRIAALLLGLIVADVIRASDKAPPEEGVVHYKILLDTIQHGYDGKFCWVHPRAGIVPRGDNRPPAVVLTMQKLLETGSDVFYVLTEMRSNYFYSLDWMGPYEHTDTLGRRDEPDGGIVAASDLAQVACEVGQAARHRAHHRLRR